MPVIVVGADTPVGTAVLTALADRDGEVRAFVTSEEAGRRWRSTDVRVAVGDVSDGSHVAAAAFGSFSAVLIARAAADERERSFAAGPDAVLAGWAAAIGEAEVIRAIWVGAPAPAETTPETWFVPIEGRSPGDIAARVAELDDRPA